MTVSHASLSRDIRIGHVHLRVADLERSTAFYRDVLGFRVTIDGPAVGVPAVFLATGDYHHHIALNTFGGPGAPPAPAGYSGLYRFALLYPGPLALADAVARLYHHRYPISDASDHGISVSLYLEDPDGNGLELYCDRPRSYWFDEAGQPIVKSEPFDPLDLLQVLLSWPEAA
jgi:catechol 2,3-dioxygenase